MVRIKQTKDFSKSRSILVYDKLKLLLNDITKNNPSQKTFTIED